jgi:hypothetical protein
VYERVFRFAEARRRFHDGIEDGLQLRRRAANDVENVAGRGLVFERLSQLRGSRLHLFEQSDIN